MGPSPHFVRLLRAAAEDVVREVRESQRSQGLAILLPRRINVYDGYGINATERPSVLRRMVNRDELKLILDTLEQEPGVRELELELQRICSPIGKPTAGRIAFGFLFELAEQWVVSLEDGVVSENILEQQAELLEAAKGTVPPELYFSFPVVGFDTPVDDQLALPSGLWLRRLGPHERAELCGEIVSDSGFAVSLPREIVKFTSWALEGSVIHEIVDSGTTRFGFSHFPLAAIRDTLTALRVASDWPLGLASGVVWMSPWRFRVSEHTLQSLAFQSDEDLRIYQIAGEDQTKSFHHAVEILETGRLSRARATNNASLAFNKIFASASDDDRVLNCVFCLSALLLHGSPRAGQSEFTTRGAILVSRSSIEEEEAKRDLWDAYGIRNAIAHPRRRREAVDPRRMLQLTRQAFRLMLSDGHDSRVRRFLERVRVDKELSEFRTLDEYLSLPDSITRHQNPAKRDLAPAQPVFRDLHIRQGEACFDPGVVNG